MFALAYSFASVASCMSKIGIIVGSFVAGVVTGCVTLHLLTPDQGHAGERASGQEVIAGGRSLRSVNSAISTEGVSRLQSQIVQLDGVSEMQQGEEPAEFVVIPSKLLESFAGGSASASVHSNLFSNDSDVELLLNISDQEKSQLQNGWRVMQRTLKRVELEHVEIGETQDGSVTIAIPSLTDQIADAGNEFKSEVGAVLGENRAKAFSAIKQLDSAFKNEEPTTYTIKMESTGDGFWRYHIKQQGGQGNNAWVGSKVPQRLRHLTEAANIVGELEVQADEPED